MPYGRVLEIGERGVRQPSTTSASSDTQVIVAAWVVRQVARIIPMASCLTQAISVRLLLMKLGEECIIRIGVRSPSGEAFGAHAWVMHDGRCIIGATEENLADFVHLVDL